MGDESNSCLLGYVFSFTSKYIAYTLIVLSCVSDLTNATEKRHVHRQNTASMAALCEHLSALDFNSPADLPAILITTAHRSLPCHTSETEMIYRTYQNCPAVS